MGLWNDFMHITDFLPKSIKIYKDKNVEKVEIINPKSRYAPEVVRWFEDTEKGIFAFESGDKVEKLTSKKRKKEITWEQD